MEVFAGHGRRKTPALEHVGNVLAVQAALVPAAAGAGRAFPTAGTIKLHALEAEVEVVEGQAFGSRADLQRPGAHQVGALEQLVDCDIQRGDVLGVDIRQRVRCVFVGLRGRVHRRQLHVLQVDRNRRALGVRQVDRALGLLAVELQTPGGRLAVQLKVGLIKLGAKTDQFAHFEIGTTEQLFGAAAWVVTGVAVGEFFPWVNIQFRQHTANTQAFGCGQHSIAGAKEQLPAPVIEFVRRRDKGKARQFAIIEPVTPLRALQGHAEHAVTALAGRHAEGRRQVYRHAFHIGTDHQLAVGAVQCELQLVRNITGHWQRLADF